VDASIIIVSYNGRDFLRRCLASIYEHTRGVAFEVVVVDNASRDGTPELVTSEFPQVTMLRENENGGFARGANRGIAKAQGEAFLLLNPDTELTSNLLPPMLAYLREHRDTAIVAPKLVDMEGSLQLSCRSFPGYTTAFFNRYSLLTRLVRNNRFSRHYLMAGFDHSEIAEVDWVSGACWLLSRRAYQTIGSLDERYFWSIEDVDYCQRARRAGLRVVYFPDVAVLHHIGKSAEAVPNRAIIARHRGMWRYYRSYLRPRLPLVQQAMDASVGAGILLRCAAQLLSQRLRLALVRR